MPITRLRDDEVSERLESLPGWRREGDQLAREFSFPDFVTAFAFMTKVALLAEAQQHHPDIHNSYNRVSIALSTHDAKGITERDFRLAAAISRL